MIWEVLLRQTYDGKACLNRWHYEGTDIPAAVTSSFALASAFGGIPDPITGEFDDGTIMQLLSQIQGATLRYVDLQITALYDVADFYLIPYAPTQLGTATGTPMSRFAAYALQSSRVRTDIRRGNKRLAGVTETHVGDNGIIEASMTPVLADLAEAMTDDLVYDDEGTDLTFSPVVLSYEKHDPDAEHDDFWYSKYPTLVEQLEHTANGVIWSYKANMTTQNTRK